MCINGLLMKPFTKHFPLQKVKVRDPPTHVSVPTTLARPLELFNLTVSILNLIIEVRGTRNVKIGF